jgi:hypothetical protein
VVQALHHVGGLGFTHLDHNFPADVPDPIWLRAVGEWGWLAVTRDKFIRRRPAERAAVVESGLRLFVLNQGRHMITLDYLEALSNYWRKMLEFAAENEGPTIVLIGLGGDFRPVDPVTGRDPN